MGVDGLFDISAMGDAQLRRCRYAARSVAEIGVDARSREVALAAMTAQGDRKAAALEQKEATRRPPLPARRVESVRLMF